MRGWWILCTIGILWPKSKIRWVESCELSTQTRLFLKLPTPQNLREFGHLTNRLMEDRRSGVLIPFFISSFRITNWLARQTSSNYNLHPTLPSPTLLVSLIVLHIDQLSTPPVLDLRCHYIMHVYGSPLHLFFSQYTPTVPECQKDKSIG